MKGLMRKSENCVQYWYTKFGIPQGVLSEISTGNA